MDQDADQHRFFMLLGAAFFLIVAIVITAGLKRGHADAASQPPVQVTHLQAG